MTTRRKWPRGSRGEVERHNPSMDGPGKSDGRVVPMKLPNKAAHAAAEGVEGRRLAKENLRQQYMLRTQCRAGMQRALERVRQAAAREKKGKFTALLHHACSVDALREAYFRLNRDAAAGVDDVTWQQFGEDLERKLEVLSARLRRGAYRASPVRRAYIRKVDGGQRPLGVTTVEDKVVQMAVVEVLNAIYEQDFIGFSYGFRPGRSQHHALDALCVGFERSNVNYVLDADIRGFFDSIDHGWLMKFVEHRIADQRILRLIRKWLRAGALGDEGWKPSEEGTPQGGCISPLLANVYLHYAFDLWAHAWRQRCRGDVRIVRYADDFVVGFELRVEAEQFLAALRERLAKFGLELHPDKTRLIEFGRFAADRRRERGLGRPETFHFLGFTHICGRSPKKGNYRIERRTHAKRLRRKLLEVKEELRRRRHDPVSAVGLYLRSVLDGHYRYYGVPLNYRALNSFRREVVWHWWRAMSARSQRGRVLWARMRRIVERLLPRPRICHPFPVHRFGANIRGKSPVR